MKVLALDLGNNTGWALYDDGVVLSGVWVHHTPSQARFEGGGIRFVRFLTNLRQIGRVDRIVLEEVRSHKRPQQRRENVGAAQVYGGYLATLAQYCETQEPPIPYEGISVGTIKKWATGKGNASKDLVVQRANEIIGHRDVVDDNEADAVVLLMLTVEAV